MEDGEVEGAIPGVEQAGHGDARRQTGQDHVRVGGGGEGARGGSGVLQLAGRRRRLLLLLLLLLLL